MLRALRAFVWLRWRMLLNSMRFRRRRDSIEQLSRVMSVVTPVLIYILFAMLAAGLGGLAFTGARLAAAERMNPFLLLGPARIVLLAIMIPMAMVPAGRSAQDRGASTTRMLLLPIPRNMLHLVEVVAGLFDPWLAFVPLVLAAIPAGFFSAGRGAAALVALAAGSGMLACIACLGALGSFVVQWILRNRRRGELAVLLGMIGVITLGFLPTIVIGPMDAEHRKAAREENERRRNAPAPTLEQFDAKLPAASLALPSELYGRALRRSLEGSYLAGLGCGVALWAEASLLFFLSGRMYQRVLLTPAVHGRRRRQGKAQRVPLAMPGLFGPVSAVALAQARGWLRTVRGKLSLLMTAPFVILMAMTFGRIPVKELPMFSSLASTGDVLVLVALAISILSLQPLMFNQFTSDRAGLTLQLIAPLSDGQLVRARALAGGLLVGAAVVPGLVVAWLMMPAGSVWLWGAALASGCATFFLIAPLAILLSMVFPKPSDLTSMGSAGNAHPLAGFIGAIVMLLSMAFSWVLTWIGNGLAGSPPMAFLLALLWAGLAAGLGLLFLPLLSEMLSRRRENLGLVAQGR